MCNKIISNSSISKFTIDILYQMGVRYACISPGSRNTPLTKALIDFKKIKCSSHIDERSCGYFALGISKASNAPVVVLTTSGTATANLFPSIIEASLSKTPLIIITADRPKSLINTGASQTINQKKLYGNYVRNMIDFDPYDKSISSKLSKLSQRIYDSIKSKNIPGPIHLNFRFSKPLLDQGHKTIPSKEIKTNLLKFKKINLPSFNNALIICGPLPQSQNIKKIISFAKKINAPIFADVLSQLRNYKHSFIWYDQYINKRDFKPDIIIRLGDKPTSDKLNEYINKNKDITYLIDTHMHNDDAKYFLQSDLDSLTKIKYKEKSSSSFYSTLKKHEDKNSNKVQSLISTYNTQAKLINNVLEKLNNYNLFIGSSTILRSFENYSGYTKNANIYSNSITRGIDGITSSALGMAYFKKKNNHLFIGDISIFYDMAAFHVLNNLNINLSIYVVNNKGGQIFTRLAYADKKIKDFEKYWITPLKTKIEDLTKLFNIKYYKCNFNNIEETLTSANKLKGIKIFEIPINEKNEITFTKKLKN